MRPNLFIIGAMKSGTSSLHSYLGSHPQIFMSTPKEPMFFSRKSNGSGEENDYLALFAPAGDASMIGESSTEYTKAPEFSGVPQRIHKFNPEARFIYIMRDPIERVISQYWHMVYYYGGKRDMLTAIRKDSRYINISNYAMQLEPYFKLFGKDKVYVMTFEELRKNTLICVQGVFRWLGVESSFVPPNINLKRHVTPRYLIQERGPRLLSILRHTNAWMVLKPFVPRQISFIGRRLLVKEIDRVSFSIDKVTDFLRPIQLKQTDVLSKMLDRDFPEWERLFGADAPTKS